MYGVAGGAWLRGDTQTHLQITGGVQEDVAGLEVPVQDISRVDVLEPTQDLVHKIPNMVSAEPLCLEQLVQISLHQSLHHVSVVR